MVAHLLAQTHNIKPGNDGVTRSIDPGGFYGASPSFVAPVINKSFTADQFTANGSTWTFTPSLDNSPPTYHFYLDCHPDEATINPLTGEVTLDTSTMPVIAGVIPDQSVYIQIACCNAAGVDMITIRLHIGKVAGQLVYMGPGETYTDLHAAMAAMSSGYTLVVRDGTYTGENNTVRSSAGVTYSLPSGTAATPSMAMAETPGRWVIDGEFTRPTFVAVGSYLNPDWPGKHGGAHLSYPQEHILFQGLRTVNSTESDRFTHATRVGFRYCIHGGAHTYSSTHNIANTGMDNMEVGLYEQSFVLGYGRYKFASYQGNGITTRRCVTRYDSYYGTEPSISGFSYYRAQYGTMQNNWTLDSDDNEWHIISIVPNLTNAYQVASTGADSFSKFNKIQRSGCVNTWNAGVHIYGTNLTWAERLQVNDFININQSFPNSPSGVYSGTARGPIEFDGYSIINADYSTMAEVNIHFYERQVDWNNVLFDLNNVGAKNLCDMWAVDNLTIDNASIYNFTNNLTAIPGDHTITNRNDVQATSGNGAMYPIRLEDNSTLKTNTLGADNLDTFIGRQGTQYGDADREAVTTTPSLPIQMESVYQEALRDYSWIGPNQTTGLGGSASYSGDFGIALESDSPSYYIMASMGNPVYPLRVGAVSTNVSTVRVSWDIPPSQYHTQIIGFDVFYRNVTDAGAWTKSVSVDRLTNSASVSGLTVGKDYEFYTRSRYVDGRVSGRSNIIGVSL